MVGNTQDYITITIPCLGCKEPMTNTLYPSVPGGYTEHEIMGFLHEFIGELCAKCQYKYDTGGLINQDFII